MKGEKKMEALAIKDVEFNGAMLRAAQNELGKIFVGVRWICDGLGLTVDQRKRQIKNIQEDLVVSKGVSNLTLPTNGGEQKVFCLDIEFLPLWLAKISVTPAMKRENPDLVDKLIEYQLRAKDVLAKAFLPEEVIQQPIVPQNNVQTIQLSIPDMTAQFDEMNNKIDRLYNDMSKFVKFMMDWKEHSNQIHPIVDKTIDTYNNIMSNISNAGTILTDCKKWKDNAYALMDNLLLLDSTFADRKNVLNYIYRYMNKNYGIVWAQEIIDYKEKYNLEEKPSTIDIVYNNETYRSIFDSVLLDLISKTKPIKIATVSFDSASLTNIIAPLAEKYDDHSPYQAVTYRRVYKQMENTHKVSWKNQLTRFKKETKIKPCKINLILSKPKLQKKFEESVQELLAI